MTEGWWAAALSEEVTSARPINVDIGDQPVVLWRDGSGVPRALEDRCPHRRAPLSLGCVLPGGMIQCGYHGWTYDGATGQLTDIPNLKSKAKFPKTYRAAAFAVAESGGFVRVSLDPGAAPPAPAAAAPPLSGKAEVTLEHKHYVSALFDDPAAVLAIRGVRFTPYLASELTAQEGRLVLERFCQWAGPHWPSPFSSEFPISLRIATDPATGECDLLLRDTAFRPLLEVTLAPVPAARGVTQVRWRARLHAERHGMWAKALGIGAPFRVLSAIDGAALRRLNPSASIHADSLRADAIALDTRAPAA